ncbi:tetratricopeptide repeat protein [Candidatus Palauibacter sp.]|uniref:tetratricopeptide repeat protein n=1 Tax=Candidatus Palauibacter sp. TaxID=3101350 RepID=UPI003B59B565
MDTPQSPPSSHPSRVSLARELIHRRVPHVLAIYAGASWGLVEFTSFAADEFLLSPHWARMVLVTLFVLLPSILMFAWFHGKPGRDRDSLARTEKIGIPANLVLCVVVLWALFGGEELGSVTTSLTVETEDGETIEREVPKSGFRKTMALFPLDPGPGIAEDESWISYAVPEALVLDLMPDDFFAPIRLYRYGSYARERGFDSFAAAPLALKRELAQESYAEFMATGEIDRVDDLLRVTLRLYGVGDGSLAGEAVYKGIDLLALVDEMSGPVKAALEIPAREGIEDLPVRGRLSENAAAVEAFFKGIFRHYAHRDAEGAIEYLTTATTLDPSFTVAQYTLYQVLQTLAEGETVAAAPLVAAMENLYRMPERYGFQVKADYYRLTGEMDRAAVLTQMWIELYPNDLNALRSQAEMQISRGDWEDLLATFAAIRRLDPLDGGPILGMAQTHEQLGNHDRALSLLTEYVERFPGETFGYSRLADFHRRRGRYRDAREAMERAIVLEPLAPDLARGLAELDLDIGRLDEARAGYERSLALARTPHQRAQALSGLTHYHRRRGEMADAIQAIEARLQEESGLQTPLGMAFGRAGDIFVYLDAGRVDEAGALLEELQAQLPASLSTYLPRLAVHVALEAEGLDAALEAQRQASEVVEAGGLEGLRPVLLGDLGLIRDRQGDYAGAAESFRAAIALSPEGRFYRGAGRALRRAGLLDQAEAELREALRLVPADPHAHVEMGLLTEALGDVEAAVEHLMSALAVWENADEDFEPARETRAKLAELGGGGGGVRPPLTSSVALKTRSSDPCSPSGPAGP